MNSDEAAARRAAAGGGVYAVLAERRQEGPILWETTGPNSGEDGVGATYTRFLADPDVVRVAVVKLEYAYGNELLLPDMERMQTLRRPG